MKGRTTVFDIGAGAGLCLRQRGGIGLRVQAAPARWHGLCRGEVLASARAQPPGTPYKNTEKARGRGRFLVPFPK